MKPNKDLPYGGMAYAKQQAKKEKMEMEKEKLGESVQELEDRFFDICEEFKDRMQTYEFAFCFTRIVARMTFDIAPTNSVAFLTLLAGIEQGLKEHEEYLCEDCKKEMKE